MSPTKASGDWMRQFDLTVPLILAPMGGGPTTPQLTAAGSNAGAFGFLAAAYLQPAQILAEAEAYRALSSRPFGINLFTPMPKVAPSPEEVRKAVDATRSYREELHLPPPNLTPPFHPDFEKQFAAVLDCRPRAFSFVFGALADSHLRALTERGIYSIGTATSLEEAQALEASGVDAVIAQGFEAGGHRGIFAPDGEDPAIGTFAFVRTLVQKLRIPVIAAGGIMDGQGIAAALQLGAVAAQLGTAFLLCDEAGTSAAYRRALLSGGSTQTTRAFSGRWARGIENRFMREMEGKSRLAFPAQNAFTRDLRAKSAELGSPDFLSLWAGQGLPLLRDSLTAGALIEALRRELDEAARG